MPDAPRDSPIAARRGRGSSSATTVPVMTAVLAIATRG
jgi:hypothetical protein